MVTMEKYKVLAFIPFDALKLTGQGNYGFSINMFSIKMTITFLFQCGALETKI